jgi:hypothetical protein
MLLMPHPTATALGVVEAKALLALLAQLLQHAAEQPPGGTAPGCSQQQAHLPELLLLPLLQQMAFSSSDDGKQWAGHLLSLLSQQPPVRSSTTSAMETVPRPALHGAAAATQSVQVLLHQLWQHQGRARHWLASLQLTLGCRSGGSVSGGQAAKDQHQVDGGAVLVLCALLQHPAEAVQRAALRTAGAAMEATALLGLTLLPLLVQQLQRQAELFLSGGSRQAGRQAAFMQAAGRLQAGSMLAAPLIAVWHQRCHTSRPASSEMSAACAAPHVTACRPEPAALSRPAGHSAHPASRGPPPCCPAICPPRPSAPAERR